MKICPVAIAVGCAKCPVFKVCPLKSALGDQPAQADKPVAKAAVPAKSARNTRVATPAKGGKAGKAPSSRRK